MSNLADKIFEAGHKSGSDDGEEGMSESASASESASESESEAESDFKTSSSRHKTSMITRPSTTRPVGRPRKKKPAVGSKSGQPFTKEDIDKVVEFASGYKNWDSLSYNHYSSNLHKLVSFLGAKKSASA